MSIHGYRTVTILLAVILSTFFFLSGCEEKKKPVQRFAGDNTLISAYTSGLISRESTIKIVFIEQMVDSSRLNLPLDESPFRFKPGLKGVVVWTDRRTLEFRPESRMPDGTDYEASLNLENIAETIRGRESFNFKFATIRQSFEISVFGLQSSDERRPELQQISGMIVTADVEDAQKVEQMLKAQHEGNTLNIMWQHAADRRENSFTIDGIVRGEDSSEVEISWDGEEIGVDKDGKTSFTIPSRSYFTIAGIRPVRGETEYIELRFTDLLDKNQNLLGLITIENREDLRIDLERSILRIYSSSPWEGTITVTISAGLRNSLGYRLNAARTMDVTFEELKPQVRFAGKGAILPTTQEMMLPVETVNLQALTAEVSKIYERNIPQFLQVNALDGDRELERVAQIVWKKTISLNVTADKQNHWLRHMLDLKPLVEKNPGGIYRIKLSFKRQHILYNCGEVPSAGLQSSGTEVESGGDTWTEEQEASNWDWYEEEQVNWYEDYQQRLNPCHPAYYRKYYDHDISVYRNIIVSDIGLLAKQGSDKKVFVSVTDLKTTQPLSGAEVEIYDYQQQSLTKGTTDAEGTILFELERKPYLIVARNAGQSGYLKLNDGSALAVSHFDVSGENITSGLKGFLYGERGVWRPGDPIYLTFILYDPQHQIPESHPVICEFYNPQGQLLKTLKKLNSVKAFYDFKLSTEPDAPTGNWLAKVKVGGATFEKTLKIETIMPNRLKMNLDFGSGVTNLAPGTIRAELSAKWLHGALARNLQADVELSLVASRTSFPGLDGFVFDDPVKKYEPESRMIFEGQLDASGKAEFSAFVNDQYTAPGRLEAVFRSRVFEAGGSFSTDRFSIPLDPFSEYVGIKTPAGDKARGMLLTDTLHAVQLRVVDRNGKAIPRANVEMKIYKIKWRWWWEKGDEYLADYVGTSHYRMLQMDTVQVFDGKGVWQFKIKYPDWGRFLIMARDLKERHSSGRIVYIDWPGWAGRGGKESPGGATVLTFSTDKSEYQVGEKVMVTIPTAQPGRGLVSIENGSKILSSHWIQGSKNPVRFDFTATAEMAPNVYVFVTFIQPHLQAGNDLPIRMYGVVPVKIFDPGSRLEPKLETVDVFKPEHLETITVSEAKKKAMVYTLALVDEGLLGITRFQTPDPWSHFYSREALGVKTWDLYDEVAGAYGIKLEQLLAIGGDAEFEEAKAKAQKKAHRFPPVVQFLGPFELKSAERKTHQVQIPQYVGALRLMVVAGKDGAYGATEKEVPVRSPVMILGTLPRVMGLEEHCDLPITVFAMEPNVKNVTVKISCEGPVTVNDSPQKNISFANPGDEVVRFKLKTQAREGVARVKMEATSNGESAHQTIEFSVRSSSLIITEILPKKLEPDAEWIQQVILPGVSGTNKVTLEVSRIPPLNLGQRLSYLIRYPHGCVEQVTSAVFPQLYLDKLLNLSPDRRAEIEKNIKAGIERLRLFQSSDGGFSYWQGDEQGDEWASNYAGHFLTAAEKAGYAVPQGLLSQWHKFQLNRARSWITGPVRSELIQAYRLFTLAYAGKPDLGAMNRLREQTVLYDAAVWQLAAAYQLAGQPEASAELAARGKLKFSSYRELSYTYGSDLRDKAIAVEALSLLGQNERAFPLVEEIAAELSSEKWLSTQSTAYALMAIAVHTGITRSGTKWNFTYQWDNGSQMEIESAAALYQVNLNAGEKLQIPFQIKSNTEGVIFPRLILEGLPEVGKETSGHNGMRMEIRYLTLSGEEINPVKLEQGTDFMMEVDIKNTGSLGTYDNVALTSLFPPGWEIRNTRLDPAQRVKNAAFNYQDIRDDRIMTYFNLKVDEQKTYRFLLHASYAGRYYLPMIQAEPMYDATLYARQAGQWIEVVVPGD
jgi:alpha-2-macroglobulin